MGTHHAGQFQAMKSSKSMLRKDMTGRIPMVLVGDTLVKTTQDEILRLWDEESEDLSWGFSTWSGKPSIDVYVGHGATYGVVGRIPEDHTWVLQR